jgi:hypothetical protein
MDLGTLAFGWPPRPPALVWAWPYDLFGGWDVDKHKASRGALCAHWGLSFWDSLPEASCCVVILNDEKPQGVTSWQMRQHWGSSSAR